MSLTLAAPQQDNDRYLAPADNHPARCVELIDMGTQKEEYEGETSERPKVRISFELVNEEITEGMAPSISKKYTAGLGDRCTLRHHLENWRGKPFTNEELQNFDLGKLLGQSCMVQVQHQISKSTGNPYAKINGIGKVPKGLKVGKASKPLVSYSGEEGESETFLNFPQWLQEEIALSPEFQQAKKNPSGSTEAQGVTATESEEHPF